MTVEDGLMIDMVSINRKSGKLSMTISDHLEWGDQIEYHLDVLEKKIDTY